MYIAYAADGSSAGGLGNGWMTWVMIAVIFAALYFFTIRPQNKRDKELKNFRNNLKPGDEIVTIGGIYGRVVRIMEDRVVIVVGSEKTKLEMAKSAINSYASPSNAGTSSAPKAKEAEEPEKESKPSPKSIKKLGAAKKEAEAVAEEAGQNVAEALDEVAEKTE